MDFFLGVKERLMKHFEQLHSIQPLPNNWRWHPEKLNELFKIEKRLVSDIKRLHKDYRVDEALHTQLYTELLGLRKDLLQMMALKKTDMEAQIKIKLGLEKLLTQISNDISQYLAGATEKETLLSMELNTDGIKAICIPGCFLCCLTTEEGAIVKENELKHIQDELQRYNNQRGTKLTLVLPPESAEENKKEGNENRYKHKSYHHLPSRLMESERANKITSFVSNWHTTGRLFKCDLLMGLDEKSWDQLYKFYATQFPELDHRKKPTFPEGFQGSMCSFYQDRPQVCRQFGCNYATKFMARAINKSKGKVLVELFSEPDLFKRYLIISRYL